MRLIWLFSLPLMLSVSAAHSTEILTEVINPNAGFFEIKEVRIERLKIEETTFKSLLKDYKNDCSELNQLPDKPEFNTKSLNTDGLSLDQIINIGKQAWEFIQSNKAVVTSSTQYASALPRGSSCWSDLSNWQRPRSEAYKATYINGFGMEIVNLEFNLVYAYGGQANNKGRYISNATIQYRKLDVFWGFKVNASVEVPQVLNVGSKDEPVAGLQMSIRWTVNGLNHLERTASFFMYGDGRPTEVL